MSEHIKLATLFASGFLALIAVTNDAIAQSPSSTTPPAQLLLSGSQGHGGFGSIDGRVTRLAGTTSVLTGVRGGWVIGHQLSIGGAAWWNATPRVNDTFILPGGTKAGLGFGYGGVEIGWTHQPSSLVHLSVSTLLGAGGAYFYELGAPPREYESTPADWFFAAEPTVGVELNVSRHVRLMLTGSYRATSGAQLATLGDKKLSGASGGLSLKFGKF